MALIIRGLYFNNHDDDMIFIWSSSSAFASIASLGFLGSLAMVSTVVWETWWIVR